MPERFATVDEFLAAQSPERRADVESLRALVHEAAPALAEIVKWNSPDYVLDGVDRLTINAAGKGRCGSSCTSEPNAPKTRTLDRHSRTTLSGSSRGTPISGPASHYRRPPNGPGSAT
ncbi:DUF1801 domain-containing protein [Occultella aeris]|uniref:DUF1801 domain-containing protein n=1 Tax=Occultella aeris TaxID=2761496 RepID=UPI0012EA7506|nr:DUF1801 domain-containing protein [Occultella aeris]